LKLLTDAGKLVCTHELGIVGIASSQSLVRIGGARVMIERDPEGKPIAGCPNTNPVAGIKPCTGTLVARAGYSGLVRINGRRACLDTITGLTDGTPPGTVSYLVRSTGQGFVASDT